MRVGRTGVWVAGVATGLLELGVLASALFAPASLHPVVQLTVPAGYDRWAGRMTGICSLAASSNMTCSDAVPISNSNFIPSPSGAGSYGLGGPTVRWATPVETTAPGEYVVDLPPTATELIVHFAGDNILRVTAGR